MNVTVWDQNNKSFLAMYDKFYVGPPSLYEVFAYGFYSPGDRPQDTLKDAFFYNINSSFTTYDNDQVKKISSSTHELGSKVKECMSFLTAKLSRSTTYQINLSVCVFVSTFEILLLKGASSTV